LSKPNVIFGIFLKVRMVFGFEGYAQFDKQIKTGRFA